MIIAPDHDGPYPLIAISCAADLDFADHTQGNIAHWLADELALTHNVIIRALNSIWLNAPLLLPGDEPDFVGYALACLAFVRAHHRTQEETVFPHLQVKLDMRSNVVEHITFEAPLKKFESYLERVRDGKEKYDMEKVLVCRNEVGNIMVQHFHDEVGSVRTSTVQNVTEKI